MTQPQKTPLRKNFHFDSTLKLDARNAILRLRAAGLAWTLDYAASIAMDALGKAARADIGNTPLDEAISQFLVHRQNKRKKDGSKLRETSITFHSFMLDKFAQSFPGKNLGDVSRQDVARYVESRASADWRSIRAFFNWAAGKEPPLVAINPVANLRPDIAPSERASGSDDERIKFMQVERCAQILRNAGAYRHAAALGFFAGLRPSEIARERGKEPLRWEYIDRVAKTIRVPSSVAKTGHPRIIETAFPVLWEWLADAPKEGVVCDIFTTAMSRAFQKAAGYEPGEWPRDGIRHTFATYHVALYQDLTKTATAMGHESNLTMLHRHYRGLTTKADAEKFAALSPQSVGGQVKVPVG